MIIDGFLILVYAMAFYYYKHLIDLYFKNKKVDNKKETLPKQEPVVITGRRKSL